MPLILSAESATTTLDVSEAWIREAPPNAMALAGYMTIDNNAPKERHLLAVSSADFKTIELHRSQLVEGVARMIPQQTMPVPTEGRLVLEPGDYHLMMMHPGRTLREGDEVNATLKFDNDEFIAVTFRVKKAEGSDHEHHHHH
jgi:copper(I)-binding protein